MNGPDTLIPVYAFDIAAVQALNSYLGVWPTLDKALWVLGTNPLFKGFLFVSLLLWLGAGRKPDQDNGFCFAIKWIAGLAVGLLIARYVQNFVPSHLRPISEPALALRSFRLADNAYFARLYSFPSDHAVMFFGLSTAIFSRNRGIGALAFLWSAAVICAPRVYFGYHYPSDVIAGAALGVTVMAAALAARVPDFVTRRARDFETFAPGLGHGLAFFICAEIAVNFDHVREIVVGFGKAAGQ